MIDPDYKSKVPEGFIKACRIWFPFDEEATALEKYCIEEKKYLEKLVEDLKNSDDTGPIPKDEAIYDQQIWLDLINLILIES